MTKEEIAARDIDDSTKLDAIACMALQNNKDIKKLWDSAASWTFIFFCTLLVILGVIFYLVGECS